MSAVLWHCTLGLAWHSCFPVFQDKCTHPEDVRLCTMIVKSNGNFPVNKKKVVCYSVGVDLDVVFFVYWISNNYNLHIINDIFTNIYTGRNIDVFSSELHWSHVAHAQIFIKDVVHEGEDLELDELNNSGSSQKEMQQRQCALGDTPATSHQLLMPKSNTSPSSAPPTPPEEIRKAEKNGDPTKEPLGEPVPIVAKAFQAQALPNGKTQTSVKTMSKRKISQQKEKKATQMLAIVLGKFICLVFCTTCHPSLVLGCMC